MAVAVGDQRRNKEAQEFLVQELAKGEEDGIPNLLRTAIEVNVPVPDQLYHSE